MKKLLLLLFLIPNLVMADTKINCGGDYYFKCSENLYDSCKRYKASSFKGKIKLNFYDENPSKCKEIYNFLILPQPKKKQFYTQRANIAGAYYMVVLSKIAMKKSDCSMDVSNGWFNKKIKRTEILANFPNNYREEIKRALDKVDWQATIEEGELGALKESINKKKSEGVNCVAIQERLLKIFDNASKNWKKEIKKNPF